MPTSLSLSYNKIDVFQCCNMIDSPVLYQSSKSEGSQCFINTTNGSTLAFNFTRNSLQVHEDSLTAVDVGVCRLSRQ